SWQYTPSGEGTYSFYTKAYDTAGNAESIPASPDAQVQVNYDTTAPTTTDNAPGGWQNSQVTVTLSASDTSGGSGVAEIGRASCRESVKKVTGVVLVSHT